MNRRLVLAVVALCATAMIVGSVPGERADAQSYQRISGEGSSWSANAIDAMRVNVRQFGITVDYNPSGSSAGRKNFLNGTVDFAASDIPFQFEPEDGSAPENPAPGSYAYIPVTAGGTAFMYNLTINGQRVTNLRLSGENIAKIFTGVITQWNDPALVADNPGLTMPARAIVPVVRSDGSGSTAQFSLWMIAQHRGIWEAYCAKTGRANKCGSTSFYPTSGNMIAQGGDLGVAGYVSQGFAEGAIGYVNYSYALGVQFPVAKVLNAAGYYTEPTPENVAVSLLQAKINTNEANPATYLTQDLSGVYTDTDPRNYQLSSYSYFILPTKVGGQFNEAKGRTLAEFTYYAMCQAQQQSASLGYSPMPVNLVTASFDQIAKIPGAELQNINVQSCNNPTFSPSGENVLARERSPAPGVRPPGPGTVRDGHGRSEGSRDSGCPACCGRRGGRRDGWSHDGWRDHGWRHHGWRHHGWSHDGWSHHGWSHHGWSHDGWRYHRGGHRCSADGDGWRHGHGDRPHRDRRRHGRARRIGRDPGRLELRPRHRSLRSGRGRATVGRCRRRGAERRCHGRRDRADHARPGLGLGRPGDPDGDRGAADPRSGLRARLLLAQDGDSWHPADAVGLRSASRTIAAAGVGVMLDSVRGWAMALVAVLLGAVIMGTTTSAADSLAGSAGTDTSLPLTDSAVTVSGRGQFADLKITVNQTKNLTNQAVSITWEGGDPTREGPGRFAANFLQIFQCWGDDDGSISGAPGPPPEQCAMGAAGGVYEGVPTAAYPAGFAISRIVSKTGWDNFDSNPGVLDPRTSQSWMPFRSVDDTEIGVHTDPTFRPFVVGGNFWLNPFFNIVTTNEIAAAATGPDGRGAELFEVSTGLENSGLGCGQRVQAVSGQEPRVPQCWIVIVPRGVPGDENVDTPFGGTRADQFGVYTSPLAPQAWSNRIAVPIEFNPVESPCSLADVERRIAGNELALAAVASWQPALCAGGGLPPYSYAPTGDVVARRQLTSPTLGSPGMVVVQRPVPVDQTDPSNPIVYAPLSASGLVIGFNIERNPQVNAPAEARALAGVRVADLNLTPRIVAKLLTQSYGQQITILEPPDYDFVGTNPTNLFLDPDFLRFNEEFTQLQTFEGRNASGLVLPGTNSDAAIQVWEWILADPEARSWLEGNADEWGMQVNPRYNITRQGNPAGIPFASPPPDSFPKADPYCYQAPPLSNSVVPPLLCGTDWMPYVRGFAEAAQVTRKAFDGARIAQDAFAIAPSEVWRRGIPQFIGRKSILSMTDTASADRYGIQMARLSQAGDNGANRTFIAPDADGIANGIASMKPRSEPTVREPAVDDLDSAAYPLAVINYAAVAPLAIDDQARAEYAAFLEYAAGDGQVPGFDVGQLPVGYQPLPDELIQQARAAAVSVRELQPTTPPTTTPPTTPPATTIPAEPVAPPSSPSQDVVDPPAV